ncbi:nSTAND1 domain-containing NTPase [Catenulispora pinisilvae]|uniref:nSTAND1 domain-containing NTPase n=1 Tax=Catenulispora pinisilvae TaxID=2705253 RepID=UPI001892401E|nr:helix-turn-helix domain-containing protein [Catenulispora pinisilvae]
MSHDQPSPRTSPDPDVIVTARDFGRELTLARESTGLTVRELADKASVPTSTVQGYLSGEHLPQPTYPEPFKRILAVCGEGSEATVRKWLDALTRARRAPGRRPSTTRNPYRGLISFEQEDAAWFHGREDITGEIVSRIEQRAETGGGPLVVTGPSGAGKSSLLRAGVLPALRERGYEGILLTPGAHPLDELDAVAAGSGTSGTSSTVRVLVVDQFEAVFAREISGEDRHSFINALCRPRAAGTRERTGAVVVLGIRVDFYPQALRHPLLAAAVHTDQAVVEPMTAIELRRVITEPARQAKLDVEPGLVDLVLRDLAPRTSGFTSGGIHDAGALPLLSHALAAAWERHRGGKLTIADYLAVGGITGSIAQTADTVFAALTERQQQAARRLFLRLVRTEDDSADTRRRVPLSQVAAGDDDAEAQDDQEVLDRFIAARLITTGDDTVEITHEALLTAWPQLVDWLDGDRDWRRRHHRLKRSAEQWYEADEDPDLLVRGGTLQIAREWAEDRDHRGDLGVLDRKFVEASIRHQVQEEVREQRRVGRRYRFLALLAVVTVIAGSLAVFARQQQLTGEREQAQASSQQVASQADALRDHKVSVSMQLALAAYRISPTREALSSLLNSTGVTPETRLRPSSGADAETIAVSGNLLAMGTDTGQVQLWSLTDKGGITPLGAPFTGSTDAILALAFDGGAGLLAAAGKDGNVHLWNTRNPAQPLALGTIAGTGASIDAVALSPDGQRLAAGNGDGRALLWNISDPSHPLPAPELIGPTLSVTSVAFAPDGRILAAGSDDDTVHLWQVADTAHPVALSSLNTPNSRVFAVAISPNGRTLAAGTAADHDVHLWDITDPSHPVPAVQSLTGPASWVNSVAFSPDGRTLAAGSSDGLLWMFDLGTGQPIRKLPHSGPITTVDYRDDGTVVSATVDDGTVHWWRLPGPIIVGAKDSIFNVGFDDAGDEIGLNPGAGDNTLTMWNITDIHHPAELGPPIPGAPGPGRFSGSGALSPDGRLFAAGDVDGTVQLFDVSDPKHPATLGAPFPAAKALIESVPISPKGDLLAAGSDDGTVRIIDISDPRNPRTLATVSAPTGGNIYQAVFSPDEHLMAAYSDNHNAYLYDISQPTNPVVVATLSGFTSAAYSAAFNANGHLLAVGSAVGTVRVWDITDPKHPAAVGQQLAGPIGYIYALSFAPTKDILAMAGSSASPIWLWDLTDPHHAVHLATLDGPASGAFAVTFSPNGEVLAAGGVDHTAQLWDTSPSTAATWICSVVGEPITRAEWDQYVPGRPYAPPCG